MADYRDRLYEAYATTHAGTSSATASRLSFRRDILPHLPASTNARIVDLGCGQGQLVQQLLLHGYTNSWGVDISTEQVSLAHASGINQVVHGDFKEAFEGESLDVVTATDFFEHLTRSEILEALDHVYAALRPSGVLILRVPNAVSPFGGNYRYGDMTHETFFTSRSIRQLAAAAKFDQAQCVQCAPPVHGAASFARLVIWRCVSAVMKTILAAETGQLRGHLVTQNIVGVLRKRATERTPA